MIGLVQYDGIQESDDDDDVDTGIYFCFVLSIVEYKSIYADRI